MTWIPPEITQTTESSTPSNGWVPPEVKKKEEPVSFVGSESLGLPSASTVDKQPLTYMQQQLRDNGLIVDAPTTKELNAPQSGSETLKALKSSSARALGGIIGLPNFIEDQIGAFVLKPIMKGFGYSEEEAQGSVDRMKQAPMMGSIFTGALSEAAQQQTNKYASSVESTMKQYDEGILGSLNSRNYADAGAQIWKGAVQSLPYLAMTAATSGGGSVAVLGTIGTTAAAQRYGELIDPASKEGKTLSETGKIANSWAYGGFEAAGELVTAGLLNTVKRAAGQIGKEAIEEIGKGFVKEAAKNFALEGSSEAMTELGQQTTDYLQGLRDNIDFKAIGDVAIIGGVTGSGIAGATTAANKTAKMLAGRKIATDEDVTKVNENNAKIVDLLSEKQKAETPEAANVIDAELANVAKENKDIIDSNEKKAEKLAPEEIVKLKDLDDAIDSYDVRIESPSETDNPELLKQIKDKLVSDKETLIKEATSRKAAPEVVQPTKQEAVVVEETKDVEIKPNETIFETVELQLAKEVPIVSVEEKEGLKQQKEQELAAVEIPSADIENLNISDKAKDVLGMSIDEYNNATPEQKIEMVKTVSDQIELNKKGEENIGFGLDKDMVEAGTEFLNIIEQQKQPTVVGEQIGIEQLKLKENGKESSKSGDEAQRRQEETLLKESKIKLEREVKKEENKARLGRIFDNAAKLTGARLDITSEEKRTIRKELARDVVDYVKTEFDLLGEALVEKVKSFVKDNNIPLEDISDNELNEVLKEKGYAEKIREQNKGDIGTQKGVVEGTEGKLPVGNDVKDKKTPRGKDEIKQKASKLSSNGKDIIKVGRFETRLTLDDTKLPESVKEQIKERGIGEFVSMSDEQSYAIARQIASVNTIDEITQMSLSPDVHPMVRVGLMLEANKIFNKEVNLAEKEGRTADAQKWSDQQIDYYEEYAQINSRNAALLLRGLGTAAALETFAPFTHVVKYKRDTAAERQKLQSTDTHKKSVKKAQKAAKTAYKEAVDGAINDPKVQKIIKENEGKPTSPVKPDRLAELKKKEKSLIEKLKKSFGGTLTSGGLTKEGIEALGELAVVYIEEAGYHVGNAIKKLIKTAKAVGFVLTEKEALDYMPKEIEGKPIKEKQAEEETAKAADKLANKIFGEVVATKQKEDPLLLMVNTLLGKFKERDLGKERKKPTTDIERIADAIQNKETYSEVWKEALDLAVSKIEDNELLDDTQKEEAVKRVEDAYGKATNFTFTEAQVDRAIKRKMAELGVMVSDVVREFYDIQSAERGKLSDALIEEAGLSKEQAKVLAEAIERRFDTMLSEGKKKIVEKYIGKIKDGATDAEKSQSKQRKTKTAELLELINIGAFESPEFREAYATAVGIPDFNPADAATIRKLGEEIQRQKEPLQKHKKIQDLLGFIKLLGGISPSDMALSIWYANTLSGIKTQERNIIGGTSGVTIKLLSDALVSGRPMATARGYVKGLTSGWTKAIDAWKEGYAPFSSRVEIPSTAEIYQMRRGLFKPIWNSIKYVGRTMNALDLLNAETGKEAFATVLANEALKVNRWKALTDPKYAKEQRELVRKYLITDKETVARLKKEIEDDAVEFGYTELDKRMILIDKINRLRPTDVTEQASRFGIYGTGNTESFGTVGFISDRIADLLKWIKFSYSEPKTGKQKTIAPLSLFAAFTKIAGNYGETSLNYFPGVGLYRVGRGAYGSQFRLDYSKGATPYTKYAVELTPREKRTIIGQQILGTVAMVGLYVLTQPDDEGKSKIRITANGTGDYKANKNLTDWQEYSIGVTDDNGKTTWVSYKNTSLILPFSVLGYMRDSKMYKKEYKDVDDADLFTKGIQGMPSFLGDMSAIGSMTKVFDNLLNSGSGKSTQSIPDNLLNTVKNFYTPAIYRDVVDLTEQMWDVNVEAKIKGTSFFDLEAKKRQMFGRNPISVIKRIINKQEVVEAIDVYGRPTERLMPLDIIIKRDSDPTEADKLALYHQKYANVPVEPNVSQTLFEAYDPKSQEYVRILLDQGDKRQQVLWHNFIKRRGELILQAISDNMDLKDEEYRDAIEPAIRDASQQARLEIEEELAVNPLKDIEERQLKK